ncbi:helix-turn-helix domain-containing protein [Actinokineospora diospyrosa]|uniref:helix-turn-helix domain-containing protein n=1 Tax=Actinokineospora diospyrosa TaxID=103728 RepID=UPI0020A3D2D0|nr:helix-turn-helix transcriptional regulator [Actinokineospora diospyrosa]
MPRRQLGRYLRDLRGRARLTVKAAAQALEWSEAKIWRIETGQTALRSLDAEAMCKVYGASAELTEYLKDLARKTKEQGWWHAYSDVIPDGFALYYGLEESVSSMQWYHVDLIPGLFQTPEYTRVLIRNRHPDMSDEEVDRRVNFRMQRKALLNRKTARPTFSVVLNETVLHRAVGGAHVMSRQIVHLAELSQLDTVTLRVVPFTAGMYGGLLSGPFIIMRFPDNGTREGEPPVVFIENLVGDLFLDKPTDIEQYNTVFEETWEKALNERETMRLLLQAERDLHS